MFDDKVLQGVIVKYFKGYQKAYHVSYDDGESEDVSENEARRILENKPPAPTAKRPRTLAASQCTTQPFSDQDQDPFSDSEDDSSDSEDISSKDTGKVSGSTSNSAGALKQPIFKPKGTKNKDDWTPISPPDVMPIHFDLVNANLHLHCTRESHFILERCMQRLYGQWKHGHPNMCRSKLDNSRRYREISQLGVKESLHLLLHWDNFGRHIWAQVDPIAHKYGIVLRDVVRFLKTFCLILVYGCSIKKYYRNTRNIYKMLGPDDSLTEIKFRAFIGSFSPSSNSNRSRLGINNFLLASRKTWGSLFINEWGVYSTDDDKQKSRSITCEDEGFVRKRHAASGGYGPVMHLVVSQLNGYILGGGLNMRGGSDRNMLKQIYADIHGVDCADDLDICGMQNEFDRGYKKEEFLKEYTEMWGGKHRGTHPRTQKLSSFPYTFGHPKDKRNVEEDGISLTRWSKRHVKVRRATCLLQYTVISKGQSSCSPQITAICCT